MRIPVLALVALLATSSGCTSLVTPPRAPADPVSTFLLVEGRHVGLVVPDGEHRLVEYSYGEWWWFAFGQDAWYRAIPAALWPTRGTLGRRSFDSPAEMHGTGATVSEVRVARALLEALAARLRARYASHQAEAVYNGRYGIHFVPDDDDYCALWNCNDAVAQWLVELGCEVSCVPVRLGLAVARVEPTAP